MPGGIYAIQNDGTLVEMIERAYDSEELLQSLLAKYPSILAGDQVNSHAPRRWLLVRREMAVPAEEHGGSRWALDHLFLDQDGIPTLVEVKRSTDSRIRREVIGQMLDYAANGVVYWADGTEAFWQRVKTNLQAGRVRLVFVADAIPQELRRVIEFLNEQMDPAEVLGIEIRQYVGQGLKTLVPRVIGLTAEAEKKKTTSVTAASPHWDERSFFEELTKAGALHVEVARRILVWATARTDEVWWGRGRQLGSFVPTLHHRGRAHQLFAVWTSGSLELYFYWYSYKPPFDSEQKRMELLDRLNTIPGIALPREAITKRPSVELASLAEESVRVRFLEVFDWVVDEIRRSSM